MNKDRIRFITRTSVLLALTVVLQYVGRIVPLGPNSNFIVGPLVNACLIISTYFVGILSGVVISILSVVGAILTGAAMPLPLAPFIILGNLSLILAFYFLRSKKILGVVSGAVLKFAVIAISSGLIIPVLKLPPKKTQTMLFAFNWPQLVTALIGGVIAIIVINRLKKNFDEK
ncbi:MAG: ECF transporter S component [Clostridiaceae bacterium]|nr:ECF transporter S component [Clostridiaceae bacterium]